MLWDDFINSMWHDWKGKLPSQDRLDNPEWVKTWLAEHALPALSYPEPAELAELKRFRGALLSIVQNLIKTNELNEEDRDIINEALAGGTIKRQLAEEGGWKMAFLPLRAGWKQIIAEIAADFAGKMNEGEPGRLRICSNEDCRWVYYDDTRNRSKRYCDDKMCGNLIKVRRHRARKKQEEHSSH